MATVSPTFADILQDTSHDRDSDSSLSDILDLTQEEGWEDVEPDDESQPVVSLFSNEIFPDVRAMLNDCKRNFHFDLVRVQKELGV
jgi:protein arginine N-methyltransferase 3